MIQVYVRTKDGKELFAYQGEVVPRLDERLIVSHTGWIGRVKQVDNVVYRQTQAQFYLEAIIVVVEVEQQQRDPSL